ncbi:MAG TPA: hypothetical protein ACHBX0_02365 [Arsenophonus sp.]
MTQKLATHVIDYLDRYDHSNDKITEFARLLLRPLEEYGASNGEAVPYVRQQTAITDWLQYVIFTMPVDDCLLTQVKKTPITAGSLYSSGHNYQ